MSICSLMPGIAQPPIVCIPFSLRGRYGAGAWDNILAVRLTCRTLSGGW